MGMLQDLCEPLTGEEIDWMPKSVTKWGDDVYAQILAYKDARVDRQRLDDVFGLGWTNKYKRDSKGVLQCGIGAYIEIDSIPVEESKHSVKEWVWRWSNGTPSDFESVKGEYSDAFKRAGFMWGIGIELYDMPNIKISLNEKEWQEKDGKVKATGYLKPNTWTWEIQRNEEDDSLFKVTAHQNMRVEGSWKSVLRFDSNPYNSKKQRT